MKRIEIGYRTNIAVCEIESSPMSEEERRKKHASSLRMHLHLFGMLWKSEVQLVQEIKDDRQWEQTRVQNHWEDGIRANQIEPESECESHKYIQSQWRI